MNVYASWHVETGKGLFQEETNAPCAISLC
jgi:hypothetical protein